MSNRLSQALSYIFPQTLVRAGSRWNREVRVNLEQGEPKLLVNGSRQSGVYIRSLWQRACAALLPAIFRPGKILVLGVGGGTVIDLLLQFYPKAQIVAVDIDPLMADISRRYFGLDGKKNLEITIMDAAKFVAGEIARKRKYDLVIVDIFLGSDVPEFVRSRQFIAANHRVLVSHGQLLVNYLREPAYQARADIFSRRLVEEFREVKNFQIANNIFFGCAS